MAARPRIDFTAIKNEVTIVQVAKMLNLALQREKDGYRCGCSTGRGDNRTLKITPGFQNKDGSLGSFYCHTCKEGGDLIGLYAHIQGSENYAAAEAIAEHFGIDAVQRATQPPPTRDEQGSRSGPMAPLDYLVNDHPAIEALGLTAAAMDALGGGFAPKGLMIGRIVIPLRMSDGRLVGYLGIATKEDQAPLLKFPKNLEERCLGTPAPEEEPQQAPDPDQFRKMFRVVS